MLIITRHVGEGVRIGDGITVTVQKINGGRVALAVEAPGRTVRRAELVLPPVPQTEEPDDE
jgi:carbon storage regulator CsrA